ncbi:hypothetical protein Aasi_1094 [Candidatus Amoebophilus asiaticus 5a2]|uniref:Endolytic murein transglycosylase n=1 Tax=Amoebophilus asiaticus (strain 5a2) TaxID=452471 RepID=B3ET85_AMOA5|nr:hypothetical protein Aasi_1094 [Candidatus Amoebophilus asiaticus 5a2]
MQPKSLFTINKWFQIIVSLLLVMLTYGFIWSYRIIQKPNILVGQPSRLLFIPPNTTFNTLQNTLYKNGYITDSTSFRLTAHLLRYDHKILPGAYRLSSGMSNWKAIQLLRAGIQEPVNIILNNIANKEELATKITQNIEIDAITFQKLLDDSKFLQAYGFTPENILTMFIPNTYNAYWTISTEKLFKRMYAEYQKFWKGERLEKAKNLNLTPIQVSILASIIEKETNKLEEAPLIAGVYINRLRRGMKLQACPTLLYIANDPSATRVLHAYIHINSPYNTYLYKGLPPGPITMPSIAMIDAVLNYRHHDYLYFVTKEDFSGYHYFAKTFKEHKENAKKYRRTLKEILAANKE